jgi:chromosome segregation ATPase
MSGDFRGAIVNVRSRLEGISQTIEALPHADDSQKQELIRLIEDLKRQLEQVPEDRAKDAEKVSRRVEALAREVDSEKPDREMVEITGESLKRAAQNLADVLPTVLTIATQIVSHVMHFV